MTEQAKKERAPRATGPRGLVVTDTSGGEWLIQVKAFRVANETDLLRALSGDLKTRKLEEVAQS